VSEGDTLARLTVTADNDQIDRVARAMNLHLDRLGVLIATTRASAAAIAHDLRTPLSRAFLVLDRAQTALEAGLDPRPAIEGVEAELTRLNSICDTILRISRLEASKGGGGLGPVALAPLLADLTETFAVLAEERGQILTLAPVPEALEIRGDAAMLSQLMANLLQNATNHCPAGARIGLGVTPLRRGVVLWVVDDAPGIAPEEREKVFAPFYSIDPNRTGGGNGLGLALVKAIADRLGAKIALGDAAPGLRVEVEFPDCRTLEVERDAV
jgi:signal transduction histidine kinase